MNTNTLVKYAVICGAVFAAAACSLDYNPVDIYSDFTEGVQTDSGYVILKDRAAVLNQRQVIYDRIRDAGQEPGYLDMLLLSESHSDNAYAGNPNQETTPFEVNSIEGSNSNLKRDWNYYMTNVAAANRLIQGIDELNDPALTEAEAKEIRAEGLISRALTYFDMVRIWGRVPLITVVGKDITAENIEEVYPAYFPEQKEEVEVYQQIEKDLLEAEMFAPENKPSNKTLFTKTVARALLAKVYAEKPLRNYAKVIEYANKVAADGISLVNNFSDLWGIVLANPNAPAGESNFAVAARALNTSESILEIQYPSGSWVTWMFGRSLDNWNFYFDFAKWITPSRDIVRAFDSAGDTKRKNESIVYYPCSWNIYYPAANYAFMYKTRSKYNSVIKIRYADILLLKAEAMIQTGDLSGAEQIINQIRQRAGLNALPVSATSNKENLLGAYLNERRLELAFEGQRWFDLCRLNKVEEVMNAVFSTDEGRPAQRYKYDQFSYKLPIPQDIIDQNPNLVQNPGY
ncbi:MAG: RagB/SusD family nutrient uptake outer membrane protein [Prevotellaceae bacterium]|jgi:hypothetical protein|nr:RagB/SusD family nutrient uptake outer membrane protein [Prevotellaceae bacterium]